METQLVKISEEMQRQAKLCDAIAQDKNEQALTGAPNDKETNERDAREWRVKSEVWLEAEAVVRLCSDGPPTLSNLTAHAHE